MDILKLLGKQIQRAREKRGITQDGLAKITGVNAKYISAIERGKKNATINTLKKIADGLEMEPYELLLFSCNTDPEEVVRDKISERLEEIKVKDLGLCLDFLNFL